MSIKEFAMNYIKAVGKAFQENDFKLLEAIEHTDVVYHTPGFPDMVGHEAHKRQIMSSQQYFSGIKQEWTYLTGDHNLFALAYKATYVSSGKIPGWPPAGKEAGRDALFLYRLKDGKIAEVWQNGSWIDMDIKTMLTALRK